MTNTWFDGKFNEVTINRHNPKKTTL